MNTRIFITLILTLTCGASTAESLLDPTRPANVHVTKPAAPGSTIHVEAIVISDTASWAIVNDTVVHQGDHLGDTVIEEISRYEVRYSRNGHSDVAQLPHSTLQVRRDAASHEDSP